MAAVRLGSGGKLTSYELLVIKFVVVAVATGELVVHVSVLSPAGLVTGTTGSTKRSPSQHISTTMRADEIITNFRHAFGHIHVLSTRRLSRRSR